MANDFFKLLSFPTLKTFPHQRWFSFKRQRNLIASTWELISWQWRSSITSLKDEHKFMINSTVPLKHKLPAHLKLTVTLKMLYSHGSISFLKTDGYKVYYSVLRNIFFFCSACLLKVPLLFVFFVKPLKSPSSRVINKRFFQQGLGLSMT